MGVQDSSAAAWSYAWWLTGDEEAAAAAVRAAASRADRAGMAEGDWLAALLQEVRAAVGPAPTMCPASEVALLHDIHGLPLDQAARLVAVDLADARTELAHGRLEALTETVIEPCVHPERLGGLAVGNPTDIAHARQCPSCGRARELLDRGRVELRELAGVAALWDAGDAVADELADTAPAPAAPVPDELADTPPAPAPPAPEAPPPDEVADTVAPASPAPEPPVAETAPALEPPVAEIAPALEPPTAESAPAPVDPAPVDPPPEPLSLPPMDPAPQDDPRSQRQLIAMSLAAVAVLLFLLWAAGGI